MHAAPAGFVIDRPLGRGAMGDVYLARTQGHAALPDGTEVALKVARTETPLSPERVARAKREAVAGARIDHPTVVRTLDAGTMEVDGKSVPYIAMECVRGQTLRQLLRDIERVPESLCRRFALHASHGLAAIHEAGLIHRDIKPDNLMVSDADELKILDLGVAWMRDATVSLTETGRFVGTLRYAAPEQLNGQRADERSDLFSLGATLHELLTGRPFRFAEGPRDGVRMRGMAAGPSAATQEAVGSGEISPFMGALVEALLAVDPKDRFQTAREVADVLSLGDESPWYRRLNSASRLRTGWRFDAVCRHRPTKFLGRVPELTCLLDAVAQLQAAQGQSVVIEGRGGAGKSRLVDEFLRRAISDTLAVVVARNPPGLEGDGAAALLGGIADLYAPADLEEAFHHLLPKTPALADALLMTLRGEIGGAHALEGERLASACVRLVDALSSQRPLVLIVEDLHFVGQPGHALFAAVARAAVGRPLLVVGTTRPGNDVWSASSTDWTRLELEPMGDDELAAMARALVERVQAEASDITQLVRLASGIPFFLIELARNYLSSGHAAGALASSLSGATPTLRNLDDADRETLEFAACIGFEFEPELLAQLRACAAGSTRDLFIETVQQLARIRRQHGLVRPTGSTFSFEHHLLHETILRDVFPTLRRRTHGLIADIETNAQQTSSSDARAHAIVRHRIAAGTPAAALDFADDATSFLVQRCAHQDVYNMLNSTLSDPAADDHPKRLALEMRLLEASKASGRLARDGARVQAAIDRFRAADHTEYLLRAMMLAGQSAVWREAFDAADAIFLEVERIGLASGDVESAESAWMQLGRTAMYRVQNDRAREYFQRVADGTGAAKDPMIRARALGSLAMVSTDTSGEQAPKNLLRACIAIAREHQNTEVLATALGNLAYIVHRQGRIAECVEVTREMIAIARDAGDRMRETFGLGNLAVFLRELGQYPESDDCLVQAAQISREIGDQHGLAITAMNRAIGCTHLGQEAAAVEHIAETRRIATAGSDRTILAMLHRTDALIALCQRNVDAALEPLAASIESSRDQYDQAMAYMQRGLIHLDAGRHDKASADLASAADLGQAADAPTPSVGAAIGLATLGQVSNEDAQIAYDTLRPRIPHFERIDFAYRLWRTSGNAATRDDGIALLRQLLANLDAPTAAHALDRNKAWTALLAADHPYATPA